MALSLETQGVDYVELCKECSPFWKNCISFLQYCRRDRERPWTFGTGYRPRPPKKVRFSMLMSFLKNKANLKGCAECKGRMHAPQKATMFILGKDSGKTHAIIWTKLEEKHAIQIKFVVRRKTIASHFSFAPAPVLQIQELKLVGARMPASACYSIRFPSDLFRS
ncbi:hypothetical protein YC2023_096352 [Brassica napus]